MKRVHRKWHRRLAWLLVPPLAWALAFAAFTGFTGQRPLENAALPPALVGLLNVESR